MLLSLVNNLKLNQWRVDEEQVVEYGAGWGTAEAETVNR
jgi:hypothetical protein